LLYPEWARKTVSEGEALPPALLSMQAGQLEGLNAMKAAGTLIAAGTDTMIAPNLQAEISSYVDGGFTPFEALKTATVNSAKALNLMRARSRWASWRISFWSTAIRARILRPHSG
jgi:imidazolonepropionase-like amidohydrolase